MNRERETEERKLSGATDFTPKKPAKAGRYRKDKSWRLRFCAALRECPNVGHACAAANVSRPTAYGDKARSAVFRAQWATALQEGIERLEEHCWNMAMRSETVKTRTTKTDKQGRVVVRETVAETSDTLAIFLLKAHNPEKYRETFRAQISPPPVEAIKIEQDVARLPDAELERIIAGAVARGALSADTLAMVSAANPELAPDGGKSGDDAR